MSNDNAIARTFRLWAKISMMIVDGKRDATTVADALQVILNKQPVRGWNEEDWVIKFSVISDGTTGPQWIGRCQDKGFSMSEYTKSVLCSPDFKPTSGMITQVAVLRGCLFKDKDRVTKKIRHEADKRNLLKPNAELTCLIRDKFTNKEIEDMDLTKIISMHEPIKSSSGSPGLLSANRENGISYYLDTDSYRWCYRWPRDTGFAFAVSES